MVENAAAPVDMADDTKITTRSRGGVLGCALLEFIDVYCMYSSSVTCTEKGKSNQAGQRAKKGTTHTHLKIAP